MQTPVKVTLAEFLAERRAYLRDRAEKWAASDVIVCRSCKSRVHAMPAMISIHEPGEPCPARSDEQFETGIPYCSNCEARPAPVGCVHG